jgi:transcriptional regulator with XRE-family HTH domain
MSRISKPSLGKSLGRWLRELRRGRGLPLRTVAAAAEMDSTLLSKIELGHRMPTEAQVRSFAAFFRIAFEELEARRLADRFLLDHGRSPAVARAALLIKEAAGQYRTEAPEKWS